MSRPLRVLVAIQVYYPTYSGAGLRYRRYAPLLREHGIDLSVVAGTPWPGDEPPDSSLVDGWARTPVGRFAPEETHDGVPVHRIKLPGRYGRLKRVDVFNAAATWRALRDRPDVVQFTSLSRRVVPSLLALRAARVPTLSSWTMMSSRDPGRLHPLLKAAWRMPFDAAKHVVVNSQAMGDALAAAGTRSPVTVIANGVDADRFRPASVAEKLALRVQLGLPFEGPLIVTTGTVSPRKAHDLMVRAFGPVAARHPTAQLVILGPRRDLTQADMAGYATKLQDALRDCGAADRVHLPGMIRDVAPYVRAADAFWFTSAQEGLPNSLLEAQAAGLPVVAAEYVGLTPEIGQDGAQLRITQRSAEALSAAMLEVLADDDLANALGQRARAWIEAEHTLDVAVQRYAALYRRVSAAQDIHRSP